MIGLRRPRSGCFAALALAAMLAACAPPPPVAVAAPPARDCPDCPEMVAIPGHAYRMAATETTFDQWGACVADGACRAADDHGWGRGTRPVVNVTLADARAYAAWLSAKSGAACRLPREEEWEHAARAGTTTAFWWGDAAGEGHANCRGCVAVSPEATQPVASYPANGFGLYDTAGNVWELTDDCWNRGDTPATCRERVMRGGSWYYVAARAQSGSRAPVGAAEWSYDVGFRVVCAGR